MDLISNVLSHFLFDFLTFVSHQPIFMGLVTSIITLCCAVSILLIWKLAIPEERWAWALGAAYLSYAAEYGIASLLYYAISSQYVDWDRDRLQVIVTALGAASTNIFFLAAARNLLGHKKAYPWWSPTIAIACAASSVFLRASSFRHIPDAAFSGYCIYLVGRVISSSLRAGSYKKLSVLAMATSISYAAIQLLYGILPIIKAGGQSWLPASLRGAIAQNPAYLITSRLDSIALVLVLLLKLGLYFVVFFLLLQSLAVVSSSEARKMLKGMLDGKDEYLSNDGAIKSIGEMLGATEVIMFLLMPGRLKEQVAQYRWESWTPVESTSKPKRILLRKSRVAELVIKGGENIIYPTPVGIFAKLKTNLDIVEPESPFIAVPIQFHGAIIGCLCVKWERKIRVAKMAVKQLSQLAGLISPIAQSHREIAALDQLSFRFTGWHAEKLAIESNSEALREMVFILHDTLSPFATDVSLNFGFEGIGCLRQERGDDIIVTQREINEEYVRTKLSSDVAKGAEFISGRLYIRRSNDADERTGPFLIGELGFVVPPEKDDLTHPTLVRQYLHRRAVRALVADILLDISRQHLNLVHKSFSVRLNKEKVPNVGEWFYEVWRAAKGAGLLWVVATEANAGGPALGSQSRIKIVERIRAARQEDETGDLRAFPLDPPEGDTHHVIKLYLPDTKTWLWMGVGRKGFGAELDFPSPWKVFLERFGQAADASLARLRTTMESQQLQIELAQAQGLAKVGVMAGTLRHQITNMIKDLAGPISTLNDALKMGRLDVERLGAAIASMKETADELLSLSTNMLNVSKGEHHAPCSLLKAAQLSQRFFAVALDQGKISLEIFVNPELEVDIPFQVASLAIASLVENAKDALNAHRNISPQAVLWESYYQTNGLRNGDFILSEEEKKSIEAGLKLIRIEALDAGEMIHCQVTDNGPGVPPHLCEQVFSPGVTSKQGSGGWGLYLVKHWLQLNRGYIDLTKNGPEGAQFTIRFPKPRLEI